MNYRKSYQDYFNVKLLPNYEIHHIDGNHSNNNIRNLVALPKELHQKYHTILQRFRTNDYDISIDATLNYNLSFRYNLEMLEELVNILKEIKPYLIIREQLQLERGKYNGSI